MKIIRTLVTSALLIGLFTISSFAEADSTYNRSNLTTKIEMYLSTTYDDHAESQATVYINFLVAEDGDLYTVDFMVTERNELIILSKEYEEEFYKVKSFSTEYMSTYSVPVTNVEYK